MVDRPVVSVQPRGPRGPTGPMPDHEIDGPRIRFREPDGTWGAWINTLGQSGPIGGGQLFATRDYAEASFIMEGLPFIITAGLTEIGIGGGTYVLDISLVDGGFQSADGQFWRPVTGREPMFFLFTGQSNFGETPALASSPPPNAFMWNWDGVEGNVGTAFLPLSSTNMGAAESFAAEMARGNPDRDIFMAKFAIGGIPIEKWLPGASSPDMWAIITGNMPAALAAAGVTEIDGKGWWQGETGLEAPGNYPAYFKALEDLFIAQSWYTESTPTIIFGIAPFEITQNTQSSTFNDYLKVIVSEAPDLRRFVNPDSFGPSFWNPLVPVHMTAAGYKLAGETAARAFMSGSGHASKTPAAVLDALAFSGMQINGDHCVSQRRANTALTGITNEIALLSDGHKVQTSGATVLSGQVVTDAPAGFGASLKITVTTPDTSLTSSDGTVLLQRLEGSRVRRLKWGINTAAYPVALCEWLKCSIAATVFYSIGNAANTRSYLVRGPTLVPNEWKFTGTLRFPGCNDGVWNADNLLGFEVRLCLGAASAYQANVGAWQNGHYMADPFGVQTNITGTNGATFQRTGLFIAPGLDVPEIFHLPHVMRPVDKEILESARHYHSVTRSDGQVNVPLFDGFAYHGGGAVIRAHYPKMRAPPSIVMSTAAHLALLIQSAGSVTTVALTGLTQIANQSSDVSGRLDAMVAGGLTVGECMQLWQNSASAHLGFDASL